MRLPLRSAALPACELLSSVASVSPTDTVDTPLHQKDIFSLIMASSLHCLDDCSCDELARALLVRAHTARAPHPRAHSPQTVLHDVWAFML